MNTTRLSLLLALVVTLLLSANMPGLAACGDNGGPGYRNQAGKCVGWEALARQCGNPPSTKCTPERVATGAESAANSGAAIRSLMDQTHQSKKPPPP